MMRSAAGYAVLVMITAAAGGCRRDRGNNGQKLHADTADVPAPGTQAAPMRGAGIGIHFDGGRIAAGDSVGPMRVVKADVQRAAAPDSLYVGAVQFKGQVELTGHLIQHPDPEQKVICFESDPESAARLPRMQGDTRRPWFCFTNYAYAAERTSQITAADRVRVRIDDFLVQFSHSDAYNTAQLVRVTNLGRDH